MNECFKGWRGNVRVLTLLMTCIVISGIANVGNLQFCRIAECDEVLPSGVIARLGSRSFKSVSPIVDFAISPSGELLAIVDDGGRIWLIETKTGVRRFLSEFPRLVELPVFSHDGRYFACIAEGRIHEWLLSTAKECLLKQPSNSHRIDELTYTSSNMLVGAARTSSDPTELRFLNLHDGTELGRLR